MDQAEPENKNIPGYFSECRPYSGLDRPDPLSPPFISEIQGQTRSFHAADIALVTTESL